MDRAWLGRKSGSLSLSFPVPVPPLPLTLIPMKLAVLMVIGCAHDLDLLLPKDPVLIQQGQKLGQLSQQLLWLLMLLLGATE